MFVLKSTLRKIEELHSIQIGELRALYEARISELASRIEDLRSLVFVPKDAAVPTAEAREADAIISLSERPVTEISEEDEKLLREQNLIFSGEYEEFM